MRQGIVSFTPLFFAFLTIIILSGCVGKTVLPPFKPSAGFPATAKPNVTPQALPAERPQPKPIQPEEALPDQTQSQQPPSAESEEESTKPVESLPPLQPKLGPAAKPYQQGENYLKEGKLDKAEMSLERALRIEPRNPYYWYTLAEIRLRQGKKPEAIQCWLKSNSLASGNPQLIRRNNALINHAQADSAPSTDSP